MATVTVTLSDDAYERLRKLAAEMDATVEQILSALAEEQAAEEGVSPAFKALMEIHMERYAKLFSQLAE